MAGGPGNRAGRAEDGCCGSGLAAQPLAARLRDDFLAEEKEVEVRVQLQGRGRGESRQSSDRVVWSVRMACLLRIPHGEGRRQPGQDSRGGGHCR